MSLPQAIFIDTCILDREHYCFESTQIRALLEAVQNKRLKLLLPAPTKHEIEKHIRDAAARGISALQKAHSDNPVLQRLKSLPSRHDARKIERQLHDEMMADWRDFQSAFTLVELDYSSINLEEVMRWYGEERPPFGAGAKSKEFPDAFAWAILKAYARKSGEQLAVVSSDRDFRNACEGITDCFYFPSLQAFTHSVLSADAHQVSAIALALASEETVKTALSVEFPDLGFFHNDDPSDDGGVDSVKVTQIDLGEPAIIGLGHREFTASFKATVSYLAFVNYDDPDSWISDGEGGVAFLHRRQGEVADQASITVTALFLTNEDWSAVTEVAELSIEEGYITVHESAPQWDAPEDYDDSELPDDHTPSNPTH